MKLFILFILILFSHVCPYSNEHKKISDYNIFKGDPHNLETTENHIPYELITPLFTDYASKHRTIFIPNGKKIKYEDKNIFDFPIGTIISKTFYYPKDFNDFSKGISLKETRILIHKTAGWIGLPYIWNEDESEAFLELAGGIKIAEWKSNSQYNKINYIIPNVNQCKGCHINNDIFLPIGPKARNINSDYNYGNEIKNQIQKWNELGFFYNIPNHIDIPKIDQWDDRNLNL